jgi:hypothetical protein
MLINKSFVDNSHLFHQLVYNLFLSRIINIVFYIFMKLDAPKGTNLNLKKHKTYILIKIHNVY